MNTDFSSKELHRKADEYLQKALKMGDRMSLTYGPDMEHYAPAIQAMCSLTTLCRAEAWEAENREELLDKEQPYGFVRALGDSD